MEQWDREHGARPRLEQRAAEPALVGTFRRDVRDLQRLPRHRHLADGAFTPTQARRAEHRGLTLVRIERRARRELFRALVVLEDRAPVRAREMDRTTDDRREDGVEIE